MRLSLIGGDGQGEVFGGVDGRGEVTIYRGRRARKDGSVEASKDVNDRQGEVSGGGRWMGESSVDRG